MEDEALCNSLARLGKAIGMEGVIANACTGASPDSILCDPFGAFALLGKRRVDGMARASREYGDRRLSMKWEPRRICWSA